MAKGDHTVSDAKGDHTLSDRFWTGVVWTFVGSLIFANFLVRHWLAVMLLALVALSLWLLPWWATVLGIVIGTVALVALALYIDKHSPDLRPTADVGIDDN